MAEKTLQERLRDREAMQIIGLFHCGPTMREAADALDRLTIDLADMRRQRDEAHEWLARCYLRIEKDEYRFQCELEKFLVRYGSRNTGPAAHAALTPKEPSDE